MDFSFSIAYQTVLGQCIKMLIYDNNYKLSACHIMQYESGSWFLDLKDVEVDFNYSYILFENGKALDILNRRFYVETAQLYKEHIKIIDEWVPVSATAPLLNTKPFEILSKAAVSSKKSSKKKEKWSHLIKVDILPMQSQYIPCITGEGVLLNNWDSSDPLLLKKINGYWQAKFSMDSNLSSLLYKIALYDRSQGQIIAHQQGQNSELLNCNKEEQVIIHKLINFNEYLWKGAGLNVQLSSLKTERSWGVGEFTDLFSLVDWVRLIGMQLIQLLPINDTTATYTDADSYPYSAISAFALHPIHLNVRKITAPRLLKLPAKFIDQAAILNASDTLLYAEAINLKWEAIRFAFKKIGNSFLKEEKWKEYYADNKEWLLPYAAYCYYRDLYKTSDFSQWKTNQKYDALKIELLFTESNANFSELSIHLFVQYHLHLQLAEAINYANKNNIVFKADLPIGVGRTSVDVWVNPDLFHMKLQAGAPPDSFTTIGQNWSFPTYNWEKMKEDEYGWWQKRMGQLSKYFDAVRIDHILGFFRIWSIPMTAVEGILGRFRPAMPLAAESILQQGILFSEDRFCEPFMTEEILLGKFGAEAEWVQNTFLNGLKFKENYNSQRKVEAFFKKHTSHQDLMKGIFSLLSNVIFLKDEKEYHYHFRINVFETISFNSLDDRSKSALNNLYNQYLSQMQNDLWKEAGIEKLLALESASNNMLLCGEDLGMVPDFVPSVLSENNILSLQVERMPKKEEEQFSHPEYSLYDVVVTPGTHDMSTLREWWREDKALTQKFYNEALGREGAAPDNCDAEIVSQIIAQHLYAPAMLSIFLLQDLLAMSDKLKRKNPEEERINNPANPHHIWNYRMHIFLEELIADTSFSEDLNKLMLASGRGVRAWN